MLRPRADHEHAYLRIGDTLQLQSIADPENGRYSVKVIGYMYGQSLMITAPRHEGNIVLLKEGQQFVGRLLSGKRVMGFSSEVLKAYLNPFPYVHLSAPEETQQIDIRDAYRVKVDLIASVRSAHEEDETGCTTISAEPAKIVDLSTSGCRIQMARPAGEVGSNILVTAKIGVAMQQRVLSLNTEIRSCREMPATDEQNAHFMCGVRFNEMAPDKQLLLHCYVYEQLVEHQ